jgi:hypothetical protein
MGNVPLKSCHSSIRMTRLRDWGNMRCDLRGCLRGLAGLAGQETPPSARNHNGTPVAVVLSLIFHRGYRILLHRCHWLLFRRHASNVGGEGAGVLWVQTEDTCGKWRVAGGEEIGGGVWL